MNNFRVLIIVLVALSLFSCKGKKPKMKEKPPITVDVMIAEKVNFPTNIEVNGSALCEEMIELHPEVSGRLTLLNIPDGASVSKGTVLAKINDAELQAQMQQLKVQLDLAVKTEQRLNKLLAVNSVNQAEYDAALSQVNMLNANINVLNAQIDKTVKAQFTQDAVATAGDSPIASYLWSKVSGTGTISFGTLTAEDTTISSDTDGTFVIKLTVTDMAGNSNSDTMILVWDTVIPTRSSISPASTSTITDSTQTITFTTSENATCYVSTDGDEAYANMSDDNLCTGQGTTSQSCTTPTLIEGTNYIYIACTDGTNPDTVDTNERLIYNLDTTTPQVQSAGGNSMMLLVLQAQAKTKEQSQVYTQEQKQILIAQLKVKLIELIQQLILLLQEQARNR